MESHHYNFVFCNSSHSSLIQSTNTQTPNPVLGTILGTVDTAVKEETRSLPPWSFQSGNEEQTGVKCTF